MPKIQVKGGGVKPNAYDCVQRGNGRGGGGVKVAYVRKKKFF